MPTTPIVGVTEARDRLRELIAQLNPSSPHVIVARHNKPVAVLMHPDALDALHDRIEELEDLVAVAEVTRDRDPMPYNIHRKELGLDLEDAAS